MLFKKHSDLEGKHAILSASRYHWINYTDERMFEFVDNLQAARRGTARHAFASMAIKLGQKLPNTTQTLNMYVNDAIGFRMEPELLLAYSKYAFGTADALAFSDRCLRIFDLKTGVNKASETQLNVYAALFCLEYDIKPHSIEFDLRIYQNDQVIYFETDPLEIVYIMDRIVELDKLITKMMDEEV